MQKGRIFMKKIIVILMALTMTFITLTGCSGKEPKPQTTTLATSQEVTSAEAPTVKNDDYTLKIGSLKGPTSMGLLELKDKSVKGTSEGSYEFTMVTAADELLGKIINKELDVALVPANMASILYTKTNHEITVLDINTLGVLYGISGDSSIKTTADLKGKTIYLTGKGTTPDYVMQHILKTNGLTTKDVTLEYKSEATEVASLLKEKPEAVGILPQPFATAAMAQNDKLSIVLDLTKEWEANSGTEGGSLVTGVTICRNDVLKEHKEAVDTFLAEHKKSAEFVNSNVSEAAALVVSSGIIEKAPIAEKAIPYCSITYIDGKEMKSLLNGYLNVLFEIEPASVGGTLPDDSFYYMP
jgi:NitT/TauT family transport system substrate-binding protein